MLSHKNYAVTAGKVQLFYFQASSGTRQPASPCCSPNTALSRLGTRRCLQKRQHQAGLCLATCGDFTFSPRSPHNPSPGSTACSRLPPPAQTANYGEKNITPEMILDGKSTN